jgi:large subunit ribosomal protein L22e
MLQQANPDFFPLLLTSPTKQYIINASQPINDKIFDISAFEKFLHDRIKVDGRVGNLGDSVQIAQSGDGKIEVITHIPFSGRYLKYLWVIYTFCSLFLGLVVICVRFYEIPLLICLPFRTKKFLKKQQLRDWLRVVSTSRGVYELRFYNVVNDEADDDED